MTDPTAPTLSALKIKTGSDTYADAALSSSAFTAHVNFGTSLKALTTINATASAASYVYLSKAEGTEPICEVAGTAGDLEYDFDLTTKITIYIADKTDATLGTGGKIGSTTTLISTYTVEVVPDLNKVLPQVNFTVGLGNVICVDVSKFTYSNNATTGGIPVKYQGTVFGVLSASFVRDDGTAGGPYLWSFDKAAKKLRLYSAVGTEINSIQVGGTILLLKQ